MSTRGKLVLTASQHVAIIGAVWVIVLGILGIISLDPMGILRGILGVIVGVCVLAATGILNLEKIFHNPQPIPYTWVSLLIFGILGLFADPTGGVIILISAWLVYFKF